MLAKELHTVLNHLREFGCMSGKLVDHLVEERDEDDDRYCGYNDKTAFYCLGCLLMPPFLFMEEFSLLQLFFYFTVDCHFYSSTRPQLLYKLRSLLPKHRMFLI